VHPNPFPAILGLHPIDTCKQSWSLLATAISEALTSTALGLHWSPAYACFRTRCRLRYGTAEPSGTLAMVLRASPHSIANSHTGRATAWQRPHPYVGSHGRPLPNNEAGEMPELPCSTSMALEPPPSSRNPSLAPRSAKICNIRACEMRSPTAKNRAFLSDRFRSRFGRPP
jgi:hypothetical protein